MVDDDDDEDDKTKWTGVNPPSVSYLATRQQHGKDRLMAPGAHHIPGPDARRWSFPRRLQLTPAPSQSSAAALCSLCGSLLSPAPWGGLSCFLQLEAAADWTSCGNDAITDTNTSEVSRWFPSPGRVCVCGPSAGEGARVRHVKMTRGETSSAAECLVSLPAGFQPPFLDVSTKPGDILAPEKRTLGFLERQKRPK